MYRCRRWTWWTVVSVVTRGEKGGRDGGQVLAREAWRDWNLLLCGSRATPNVVYRCWMCGCVCVWMCGCVCVCGAKDTINNVRN